MDITMHNLSDFRQYVKLFKSGHIDQYLIDKIAKSFIIFQRMSPYSQQTCDKISAVIEGCDAKIATCCGRVIRSKMLEDSYIIVGSVISIDIDGIKIKSIVNDEELCFSDYSLTLYPNGSIGSGMEFIDNSIDEYIKMITPPSDEQSLIDSFVGLTGKDATILGIHSDPFRLYKWEDKFLRMKFSRVYEAKLLFSQDRNYIETVRDGHVETIHGTITDILNEIGFGVGLYCEEVPSSMK